MGLIYLFFWPEVIHLRRRALPQPPGHVAGLAERPQNVAAENLVHVGLGITAAQQLLGEPGVRGNVLQALGPARDAVEVGADSYVADPGDLDNVVDVIGGQGEFQSGSSTRALRPPGASRPGRALSMGLPARSSGRESATLGERSGS